jgi:dTMP kinase
MKKGKLIAIEGGEGSGKSTLIDRLKKKYPDVVFTREPGGSDYGEEIRAVILKSKFAKQADALTHLCLFFASRRDHARNILIPNLKAGKNVVTDRLDGSSFAYQLYGLNGQHLKDLFLHLRSETLAEFIPDLYIFLDVDPKEGMRRVALRQQAKGEFNHFDDRGIDFHERIREGYIEFAKSFPNVVTIDANPPLETVWQSLENILEPILG